MKKSIVSLALLVLVFAQFSSGHAEEKGFTSLFNGKDLTGWKISEKGKFKVDEGRIVANGPRSHLFTDKQFKNFVFKAEVMTTPGSNSGLYFHTKFQESGWPAVGHEAQVNNSYKSDPVRTGSLYNVVKNFDAPVKDNVWYTQTITVKGQHILIQVNDKTIVDYTEPKDVKGTRKLSQGSFAIQAHDPKSVVYYRNIRVKPLPE
jgi:hypothetical protein